MMFSSARFNAGHSFLTAAVVAFSVILSGCGDQSTVHSITETMPETGDISVLIRFSNGSADDAMPGEAMALSSTAGGWFLPSSVDEADFFYAVALEADSAGKLMILVLPEDESFHGTRDHLVIKIDSNGIPVSVEPGIDTDLLQDTLWSNPVERQKTILNLIQFFKPDLIMQIIPEAQCCTEVTRYWMEQSPQMGITASLYAMPVAETMYRGWGVFTGCGIESRIIEGMDIQGFASTLRLISGLDWNKPGTGYPAMQAFYPLETE